MIFDTFEALKHDLQNCPSSIGFLLYEYKIFSFILKICVIRLLSKFLWVKFLLKFFPDFGCFLEFVFLFFEGNVPEEVLELIARDLQIG